jgi:hypothetical protein
MFQGPSALRAIAVAACTAVLVAAAPAGAASSGTTLKACANRKTGALRLVVGKNKTCSKRERRVSLNSIGAAGPKGDAGAQGLTGAQGPVGPQGPSATSFTQVTAQDSAIHQLLNTGDQKVSGYCSAGLVELVLDGVVHGSNNNPLDVSGTGTSGTTVTAYQYAGIASAFETDANVVSFDVLLRHEDTSKLYWLKVFGQRRTTTDCRFWGMVIPAS